MLDPKPIYFGSLNSNGFCWTFPACSISSSDILKTLLFFLFFFFPFGKLIVDSHCLINSPSTSVFLFQHGFLSWRHMLDILETYHGLFLLDRKKALLPLRGSSAIAACEWGRVIARPAAGCLAIFPLIRPQCCCVCLATVSANSKPGLSSLSAPGLNSLIIAVLGYMMCGIRFPLLPWGIFFYFSTWVFLRLLNLTYAEVTYLAGAPHTAWNRDQLQMIQKAIS